MDVEVYFSSNIFILGVPPPPCLGGGARERRGPRVPVVLPVPYLPFGFGLWMLRCIFPPLFGGGRGAREGGGAKYKTNAKSSVHGLGFRVKGGGRRV